MTPRLAAALSALYAAEVVGRGGNAASWILPGRAGEPLARKSGYQALQRIADRAGLKGVDEKTLRGTHHMRRTSASLALRAGVALPTVSAQLGHANARITAQAYAHVLDDAQLDAYAALDSTKVGEKVAGKARKSGPFLRDLGISSRLIAVDLQERDLRGLTRR